MKRIICLIPLFIAFLAGQTNPDTLFLMGNQYYEEEQYKSAVGIYERLLEEVEHVDLYYNLGNTYYRLGELGQAVWAYEKARSFAPRHKDLRHNLSIINAQVRDRIEPPDGFILVDLYRALKENVTINDLLAAGSLCVLLWAGLVWIRSKDFGPIKFLNAFFIVTVTLIVLIHAIALDRYWDISDIRKGVIISPVSDVRSAPVARGENVLFRVHEGTVVELPQSQPGWVEIILLDGKKGWVQTEEIREL